MSVLPTAVVRGRKNPVHLKFPQRLRKARKAARLSGSALSLTAGVGRNSIPALEDGSRVPRLPMVERLARALKVSPAWLAFGAESEAAEVAAEGPLLCSGLAKRIREVREALGLANKDLARRADVLAAEVRAFQAGTMPGIDTAEALATALDVRPAWLAYGIGPVAPTTRRRVRAQDTPIPLP